MKVYSHYSKYPMSKWRWRDFTPEEMACRGTGKLAINERAMDMLQDLRDSLGAPMVVNSAYRSPEHNRAVGGATHSKHLEAIAFDVRMHGHDPIEYIRLARLAGFQGIGEYADKGFTHVDARDVYAHFGSKDWPRDVVSPPVDYEVTKPAPRKPTQSTTLAASAAAAAASVGTVATGVSALEGNAQTIIIAAGVVVLLAAAWIARERIVRGLRDGW
jgi:zinc D-Ala-D-Ala carboxypeptidase